MLSSPYKKNWLSFTCLLSGVVVIDNQPEVTIDDPAYLFETNEGFQEVMSKKTQRQKQKLVQEQIATKKSEQSQQGQMSKKKDESRKEKVATLDQLWPNLITIVLCAFVMNCSFLLMLKLKLLEVCLCMSSHKLFA